MQRRVREFCQFIACRRGIYLMNVRPFTDPMWEDWIRTEDCCQPNTLMDCIRYLPIECEWTIQSVTDNCFFVRSICNCRNRRMWATNSSIKLVPHRLPSTMKWRPLKVCSMPNEMWPSYNGRSSLNTISLKRCSRQWVSDLLILRVLSHCLMRSIHSGNGEPIECCSEDATSPPPRWRHSACAPLIVDVADEDYNRLPSCLNYVRSALGVEADCKFGPAEQVPTF